MLKHSTILRKDSVDTIAIGSFDGIHLGHRQLIDKLGDNGALFVIDKDQANLTPGLKRSEYSTYPCMFYHFLKVKNLSGIEFIALLQKEFIHLKKILVGYDFQFGHNRSCNVYDLKALFDGEVEIVDEFKMDGVSLHSSKIREFLQKGMMPEANRFLGREYSIIGSAIEGQGLGKTKLVPTINLKVVDYLVPKNGVYVTRTKIDKKVYASISFIGNRLSTDGVFSIETHLLDEKIETPQGNLEVFFVSYIRENQQFDTLGDLKQQIHHDITKAKEVLKEL